MIHALLPLIVLSTPSSPVDPGPRPADEVTLRHAPPAGLALERTATYETSLSGGDLAVVMDGQEIPSEFLPPLTIEADAGAVLTASERYDARGLVRCFTVLEQGATIDIGFGGMGEDMLVELTATSPLEGAPVRFGPDEDGAVAATWADDEPRDDALLEGLVADLDLVAWMPAEAVAVGSSWRVDAAPLRAYLEPGGDLAWEWSEDIGGALREESVTGGLELRLEALEDRDGRRVARVAVRGTAVHRTVSEGSLDDVPVADGTGTETRETTHLMEGELAWDVEAGFLASLALDAESVQVQALVKDPGQAGPSYEQSTRIAGTFELRVAAAPVAAGR